MMNNQVVVMIKSVERGRLNINGKNTIKENSIRENMLPTITWEKKPHCGNKFRKIANPKNESDNIQIAGFAIESAISSKLENFCNLLEYSELLFSGSMYPRFPSIEFIRLSRFSASPGNI